jgi:hypothetical protein
MRFTEHEMTAAVTAAAQTVARGRRRTKPWDEMTKLERFYVLDAVGDQLLPALVALPDVEVEAGTRPTFTDAQVVTAVEQTLGDAGGRLRRKVVLAARVALLKQALAALPVRQDPDALINPD